MNYYNPYFYSMPNMASSAPKVGLLSRLFGGRNITFGSILSGTQKTLNVVNQTIPLVKQVHPMVKNAKTMFKVMNEFKKSGLKTSRPNQVSYTNTTASNKQNISNNPYEEGPTFFL